MHTCSESCNLEQLSYQQLHCRALACELSNANTASVLPLLWWLTNTTVIAWRKHTTSVNLCPSTQISHLQVFQQQSQCAHTPWCSPHQDDMATMSHHTCSWIHCFQLVCTITFLSNSDSESGTAVGDTYIVVVQASSVTAVPVPLPHLRLPHLALLSKHVASLVQHFALFWDS
jgi:hypothetical protein